MWKWAAIGNMATAFTRRGSVSGRGNEAEIEKLHSTIGQRQSPLRPVIKFATEPAFALWNDYTSALTT